MGLISNEYGHDGDFESFCFCCGYPLTKYQIAQEWDSQVFDYEDHRPGRFSGTLCSECKQRVKEFSEGGTDGARRRLYAQIAIDKQKIKELESTND